jgi:hypothetical protein
MRIVLAGVKDSSTVPTLEIMLRFDLHTTVSYLPAFGTSLSVPAASRACSTVIKSASRSGVNSPDKKSRISRAVLC